MSMTHSWELQQALYWALSAAPAITDHATVLDAAASEVAGDYVAIGEEQVRRKGPGLTEHDVTIEVHSAAQGFASAKQIAAEVAAVLVATPPALSGATVADLRFFKARSRRGKGTARRSIQLTFRILIDAN
ncbi:DUF3168 domain-containing protein [Roseobacter sp. HKCCA0434]|uniref:DUF3168 domain-containing protein n=1 Tax=Roseobacter sp. HKCCA0434 TaxID=3079297 RepID=UPI0029058CF8|nr:DUF3168 domain-containing protein [Roseobacter sp. HKCCA0434]